MQPLAQQASTDNRLRMDCRLCEANANVPDGVFVMSKQLSLQDREQPWEFYTSSKEYDSSLLCVLIASDSGYNTHKKNDLLDYKWSF